MLRILLVLLFILPLDAIGQSKSIDRFRKSYKEDNNVFIYSSTLQMLNSENDPGFADLVKDIEEIRMLNYNKNQKHFGPVEMERLKSNLHEEQYLDLFTLSEKDNKIFLYGKEKHGKMVGFVALVENNEQFIILDIVGSLDISKFMQLKNKLDIKI